MIFSIRNRKGLTLIEVVVSMVVVGVVALAIVSAVAQGAMYSRRVDLIYNSSNLAVRRMELLKKFDFGQLYPGAAETNIRIGLDGTVDAEGDYVRTTSLYTTDSSHLLKVTVSVDKYVDGAPSGTPVVMTTFLTDVD